MLPTISQALFEGGSVRAQSPSFGDALVQPASAVIRRYRTADLDSFFVTSLSKNDVTLVQARGSLFRLLIIWAPMYEALGNPFQVCRMYPANFTDRGPLQDLVWEPEAAPRTLEQLRAVLKSEDGPNLLGAAQALVDGGRVVFERTQPDAELLERLWLLLPDSVRSEIRLATFAHDNELGFDLLVAPKAEGSTFAGCLTDSQAGDYPQGRYELNLQIAVESGDEVGMTRLLTRRSSRQALRLMVTVLIVAVVIGLVSRLIALG